MPAARDDYIMRLITEAGAALRRVRSRLRESDDLPESERDASRTATARDADAAIAALLGSQHGMLAVLDAWSAANLLGDPDRFRLWVDLLAAKADALGTSPNGLRTRARADALRAHLRRDIFSA